MKPTEILSNEHQVILQVLECLDKMAEKALENGKLDADDAHKAVDFIRNFADGFHHRKEEDHLFRLMSQRGFSKEMGPLAVMYYEHDQGRAFVKGMDDAMVKAAEGETESLKAFVENSNGYTSLLRAHIHKEDNILYPMANQAFSENDQQDLLKLFSQVAESSLSEDIPEKYLAMARELSQRYGVEAQQRGSCDSQGCFSCG